jgi:hypothetical protein
MQKLFLLESQDLESTEVIENVYDRLDLIDELFSSKTASIDTLHQTQN